MTFVFRTYFVGTEIDSLYEKRRELQESFQKALASYHEEQKQTEAMVEKVRAEKKRDEERLAKLYKKRCVWCFIILLNKYLHQK